MIFITNSFPNSYVANEALLLSIPVAGLTDSNENPLNYTFPVPGNSKSLRSIYFFYLLSYRLKRTAIFEDKSTFVTAIKNGSDMFVNSYKTAYLLNFCLFKF